MELTKTNNGQWKPGQTGNPNGRSVGARKHFSAGFLRWGLGRAWQGHNGAHGQGQSRSFLRDFGVAAPWGLRGRVEAILW